MKKQVKILLFAVLVLVAVLAMTVLVSASHEAPTGETTYVEGTHFFKVSISEVDYYYADLAAAVTDVPEGGTVTQLAAVDYSAYMGEGTAVTQYVISGDKSYTLDGAGFTIKTPTGKGLQITGDKATAVITLQNVVLSNTGGYCFDANVSGTVKLVNCSLTATHYAIHVRKAGTLWLADDASSVTDKNTVTATSTSTAEGHAAIAVSADAAGSTLLSDNATITMPAANGILLNGATNVTLNSGTSILGCTSRQTIYIGGANTDLYKIIINGGSYQGQSLLNTNKACNYEVEVNDVDLSGESFTYGIRVNGANAKMKITLENCKLKTSNYTVYVQQVADLTLALKNCELNSSAYFVHVNAAAKLTLSLDNTQLKTTAASKYVIYMAVAGGTLNLEMKNGSVLSAEKANAVYFNQSTAATFTLDATSKITSAYAGTSEYNGGTIMVKKTTTLTLKGTGVIENTATGTYAHVIHVYDAPGKLVMQGCTLSTNGTGSGKSGAVILHGAGNTLEMTGGAINGNDTQAVYAYKNCNITVSGGSMSSTEEAAMLLKADAGTTIAISGGSFEGCTSKSMPVLYLYPTGTAAASASTPGTITITGGTFHSVKPIVARGGTWNMNVSGATALTTTRTGSTLPTNFVYVQDDSAITLTLGADNDIAADKLVYVSENKGSLAKVTIAGGNYAVQTAVLENENPTDCTLTLAGGTVELKGAGSELYKNTGTGTLTFTATSGTIKLYTGAVAPIYPTIDMTGVDIVVYGLSAIVIDTAKTVTVASLDDLVDLAKGVINENKDAYKSVTFEYDDNFEWLNVQIAHEDAVFNITGGTYATDGAYFIEITAGTLNITGGSFTGTKGGILVPAGSNVAINLSGGIFNVATQALIVKSESDLKSTYTLHVTGGTYKNNPGVQTANPSLFDLNGICNGILIEGGSFEYGGTPTNAAGHLMSGNFALMKIQGTVGKDATDADAVVRITGGSFKQQAETAYSHAIHSYVTGLDLVFEQAQGKQILVQASFVAIRLENNADLFINGGTYEGGTVDYTAAELDALGYTGNDKEWRTAANGHVTLYLLKNSNVSVENAVLINDLAPLVRHNGSDTVALSLTIKNTTGSGQSIFRTAGSQWNVLLENMTFTTCDNARGIPQYGLDIRSKANLNLTINGGSFAAYEVFIPLDAAGTLTDVAFGHSVVINGATIISEAAVIRVSESCPQVLISITGATLQSNGTKADQAIISITDTTEDVEETLKDADGNDVIDPVTGEPVKVTYSKNTIAALDRLVKVVITDTTVLRAYNVVYGAMGYYDITITGTVNEGVYGSYFRTTNAALRLVQKAIAKNTVSRITITDMEMRTQSIIRMDKGIFDATVTNVLSNSKAEGVVLETAFDARGSAALKLTVVGGIYENYKFNVIALNSPGYNDFVWAETDCHHIITVTGAKMQAAARAVNLSEITGVVSLAITDSTLIGDSSAAINSLLPLITPLQQDGSLLLTKRYITLNNATLFGYYALYCSGGEQFVTINGGNYSSDKSTAIYLYADSKLTSNARYHLTILDGNFSGGASGSAVDIRAHYDMHIVKGNFEQAKATNWYHVINMQGYCYGVLIEDGTFTYRANPRPLKDDGVTVSTGTAAVLRVMGYAATDAEGNPLPEAKIVIKNGTFSVAATGIYTSQANEKKDLRTVYIWAIAHSGKDLDMVIENGSFAGTSLINANCENATLTIKGGSYVTNAPGNNNSRFFSVNKMGAVLSIEGGSFYGSEFTYVYFGVNARGSTLQFTGGEINGGARWIEMGAPGVVTIGGTTVFQNPSAVHGFQINAASTGLINEEMGYSRFDITGGVFTIPLGTDIPMFMAYGSNLNISGGTFTTAYTMISMNSATGATNLTITGGTFNISEAWDAIYFTNCSEDYPGSVTIKGNPVFNCEGAACVLQYGAKQPASFALIEGGTFNGDKGSLIMMKNSKGNVTITGGTFEGKNAARMYYIEGGNEGVFIIKGGTHTLQNTNALRIKSDNAIVYSVAKEKSAVLIEGGTFIDNRKGNQQVFLKMNEKGTMTFSGNFKVYSKEQKTYFYYNTNNIYGDAILMTALTPVEALGEVNYYVCTGNKMDDLAPLMAGIPTLNVWHGSFGITFAANVPKATFAALAEMGSVKYGTLIFPTEYLGKWDSTTDFHAALKAYAAANGKAEASVFADVLLDKGMTVNPDGSYTYRATLYGIKDENWERFYTGISYAAVTMADGTVKYYYATNNTGAASMNLKTVLEGAMADIQANQHQTADGRVYCYNVVTGEPGYSRYSSRVQLMIRRYFPVAAPTE